MLEENLASETNHQTCLSNSNIDADEGTHVLIVKHLEKRTEEQTKEKLEEEEEGEASVDNKQTSPDPNNGPPLQNNSVPEAVELTLEVLVGNPSPPPDGTSPENNSVLEAVELRVEVLVQEIPLPQLRLGVLFQEIPPADDGSIPQNS